MWHACQEVCPFNARRAVVTEEPASQPREATVRPKLTEFLEITENEFREKFRRSPVKRAKWRGLMRNTMAALSTTIESEAEDNTDLCSGL
jgi:epoxyqueuosine reductase